MNEKWEICCIFFSKPLISLGKKGQRFSARFFFFFSIVSISEIHNIPCAASCMNVCISVLVSIALHLNALLFAPFPAIAVVDHNISPTTGDILMRDVDLCCWNRHGISVANIRTIYIRVTYTYKLYRHIRSLVCLFFYDGGGQKSCRHREIFFIIIIELALTRVALVSYFVVGLTCQ
jgi:hypothetical protein